MNPFITESRQLEDVLTKFSRALGNHLPLYRGHCYRILNYMICLQKHQDNLRLLEVMVAFHDLGIWTHGTMDYLKPSFDLAVSYCKKEELDVSFNDLETAIMNHHKISTFRPTESAEYLRRADLLDLSFGLIRGGVDRDLIRKVTKRWPYQNFQKMIFGKVFWYALENHWKPFPMMKW